MLDVRAARRRIGIILTVLLVLDAAAAVFLFSPLRTSASSRHLLLSQLQHELKSKTREAAPLHDIDKKVEQARGQIDQFYKNRIPTSYASISEELGLLAKKNGVLINAGQYQAEDVALPGLKRVSITASVTGDYLQEAKFINALERSKMFFLVDNIALSGSTGGPGGSKENVALQIAMETYLRTGADEAGR